MGATRMTAKFEAEKRGDVLILTNLDSKLLDETNIQIFGVQLFGFLDEQGEKKIILDWTQLTYLSSAALGKLHTMHKKMEQAKGTFIMCSIRPEIFEVFVTTGLDRTFNVQPDLNAALQVFA